MPEYYIEWRIEIDADSPEEAALKALLIQRDQRSTATVFHVYAEGEGAPDVIDLEANTKE